MTDPTPEELAQKLDAYLSVWSKQSLGYACECIPIDDVRAMSAHLRRIPELERRIKELEARQLIDAVIAADAAARKGVT